MRSGGARIYARFRVAGDPRGGVLRLSLRVIFSLPLVPQRWPKRPTPMFRSLLPGRLSGASGEHIYNHR